MTNATPVTSLCTLAASAFTQQRFENVQGASFFRRHSTGTRQPSRPTSEAMGGRGRKRALWFVAMLLISCFASTHVYAASLTVKQGVVVKFDGTAGMTVRDRLQTERHVVMTSVRDDNAANQTGLQPASAAPGDWKGISVEASVAPGDLLVDGLTIRYAGAEAGAALRVSRDYTVNFLTLSDSLLGLQTVGTSQPVFIGLSLLDNTVGLEASEDAQPTLTGSEVRGNADVGVRNLSSQIVHAADNWWGNASGPTDPVANPAGTGDAVTAEVEYVPFSTSIPLIDCSVVVADGNYVVSLPNVSLALECRNAIEVRLAPSADFSGVPFVAMSAASEFALSGQPGTRNIYAEFRAQTGNTRVVALPEPIQYTPGIPVVSIVTPEAASLITSDSTIAATATDAAGIDHVDFYVDTILVGSDGIEPYEAFWPIAGFADGAHTIRVVATSTNGLTGEASHGVTVQKPVVDTEGPVISDLRFDNLPLTESGILTASGVLSFSATDASDIDTIQVLFDGAPLSGGLLIGDQYAVDLILDGVADGAHAISISATDVFNNSSQLAVNVTVDTASVGAPVVSILSPATNATITDNVVISASVVGAGISHVDFYIDTTSIGSSATPPYQQTWLVQGFANGAHTIRAIATNGNGQTGENSIFVTLQRASTDADGPVISNVRFAGQTLADGATLANPGLLTFDVIDISGVQSASVLVDASVVSGGGLNSGHYSVLLDFASVANGLHDLILRAVDIVGNPSELTLHGLNVNIPPPPAPSILLPVDLSQTQLPTVPVSGTAQIGSQVQLYLNGNPVGGLIASSFNGSFNSTLTLPGEGTHQLSATAQSTRGISSQSTSIMVTYLAPAPTVQISSPQPNALISADGPVAVSASVVDAIGFSTAVLRIDGQPVGASISAPPYAWTWTVDGTVADGNHQIEVTATNSVGRTGVATRTVSVQHQPPPPPPVVLAYGGEVQSIAPSSSFGEVPIVISGRAVDNTTHETVPNALLKVVLQVGGFQRRISVSTDQAGNFNYSFIPQASDAGIYVVSIIHPDQTSLANQGSFTINRLGLSPTQYTLQAARTIPSTIPIRLSASAGGGSSGLTLSAIAADQPSGSLPTGISITPSSAVNVSAGGSVVVNVGFSAGSQSTTPASTGTVVLTAMDGAANRRGTVVVNYTLREPLASLYPQPTSVQTGAARGQQVSETVQLSNRGLIAARNVQIALDEFSGPQGAAPVPAWIYLASPASLGDIGVGAVKTVQVVAAPTDTITDGIYRVKILVAADGINGFVWVSIAVTSSEQGNVLFQAKDIYTCLPDCVTTPGLAGASIRLQNEAVLTTTTAVTSADGSVEFSNLPTGHYRYIATAPSHVSASGRLTVRPGTTVAEDIFLDYELVTFEWSVTETTIQDQYDVTLTATYQTTIPAPVMLIEPASINLPDMQEGEELAGEITITNRGLVRADNVVWYPSLSDAYYQIEYLGVPPDSFDAHQSVRLPYRVTRTSVPLPDTGGSNVSLGGIQKIDPLFLNVQSGKATTAGSCHRYSNSMSVDFKYECASGDERAGAGHAAFNKAYGQCGGIGGGVGSGGGVDPGGEGWGGGDTSSVPMASGPGCVPVCPDCEGGSPGGH
jgi:large repetitive protein